MDKGAADTRLGVTLSVVTVDSFAHVAIRVLLVLPFAWLAYRLVERPFIRLGRRITAGMPLFTALTGAFVPADTAGSGSKPEAVQGSRAPSGSQSSL